ncbi:MAG: hypothetical protein V7784_03980 [Oceanospirillaceae bacterium]
MNLNNLEVKELLQLQGKITNELIERGIARTQNNPLGDYTEWLVSQSLNLELEANSKAGYDALDFGGTRIQIKGRRLTSKNASRQLSAIRNYEEKDFDILVAIFFNEQFDVSEAYEVPHEVIGDYARYASHANSHTLIMGGSILADPRVKCIKHAICN